MIIDSPGNCNKVARGNEWSKNLKPLFTFDKIDAPNPKEKTNFLEMMSFYQFDPAGNIYYGRNKTYDIKIYSPEGKHIRTIEKEFDRRKVTQQDIDEMIAETLDIAPGVN